MTRANVDFSAVKERLTKVRYLLVCPIGWARDEQGDIWTDRLWAKDLLLHFEYLTEVTVLAPEKKLFRGQSTDDWIKLDPNPAGLKFRNLPIGDSIGGALLRLPAQLFKSASAILQSDVVHSGAAGWPIPPGLAVNPLAVLLGRPLVLVFESAFWRNYSQRKSLKARLRHWFTEGFAKWSCRNSRLAIFTHQGYLKELLPAPKARNHVLVSPASWIDEATTLNAQEAIESWHKKPTHIQLLVAARLVKEKGIASVMAVIEEAEMRKIPLRIDFIGEGPMKSQLILLSERVRHATVRVLDPIPYGEPFFSLIRNYHALLVPTLSDEQPRVIFDSFSQAVPVIASSTAGNRDLISDGITGILYNHLSHKSLLEAVRALTPQSLEKMGLAGLNQAEQRTHQAMHHARAIKLCEVLLDT
ncbi:MAG TPA: glycosyltransferase [Hydrogenophaga sp.]|uniref:glycosyltransferase n=1 Tax=Hydrogenophaga sp. TaxID=1904254 RepID=UPI002CFE747B|nr:glycosyltransferase [Hydrogenophaga sp.]HMN91985.1 glycosyltransferase [Hydrogenophaga sp.]HMP08787.1 glycosyltransferase [Hydrogenophaga sp.]